MQHLHLVGFTAELDGLIFSARRGSKSGGFVIALDDRLLDSIREAVRLQTSAELDLEVEGNESGEVVKVAAPAVPELRRLGRVHSVLSPKEIQARLRAGRSVADVADEAEVDESWILRFSSPVLAEQSRIVERALQIPCRANRKGDSAEPLAESVAENLIERGTVLTPDEMSSAWSAYHVRDSSWVVRFRYVSRRRQHVAQWAFDQTELSVVPLNRLATDLGYLDPARRKRRLPLPEAVDDRPVDESDSGPTTATAGGAAKRPRTKVSARAATRKPARKSTARSRTITKTTKRAAATRATGARRDKKPVTKRAATSGVAQRATKAAATKRASKAPATKRVAKRAASAVATKRVAKRAASAVATKRVTKRAASAVATKRVAKRAPSAVATKRVTKRAASAVATERVAKRATDAVATKRVTKHAPDAVATKRVAKRVTDAAATKRVAKRAAKPAAAKRVTKRVADGAVRTRRPGVAKIAAEPPTPVARRERPLVAVRATRPAPPLGERVVKLPAGYAGPASSGTVVSNGAGAGPLLIEADRAGGVNGADSAPASGSSPSGSSPS